MTRGYTSELGLIRVEIQTVLHPSKTCEISTDILDMLLYYSIPFSWIHFNILNYNGWMEIPNCLGLGVQFIWKFANQIHFGLQKIVWKIFLLWGAELEKWFSVVFH